MVAIALIVFLTFVFRSKNSLKFDENTEVVISMVACGPEKASELINSVKSALMFSALRDRIKFIIFCDETQQKYIGESLNEFKNFHEFSFDLRNVSFPVNNTAMWYHLFAPCASQRLFFPEILPEVDALLYLDSDTLFLSPPRDLYSLFKNFTSLQIGGLTPEALNNESWYPQRSIIPYYGQYGLNSGVKLMNLTRMRQVGYQEKLLEIFQTYRNNLSWPDQDMMNIYFHDHPEQFYEIPCEYNYRTDFCSAGSFCPAENGIKVIHGNRFVFRDHTLIFGQISRAITSVSESFRK